MSARGRVIIRKWIAPMLFCIGAVFLSPVCTYRVMAYENLVIVIDPGHGGNSTKDETDTGAHYNDVYEKTIDMITAQALYEELSQYGNLTVYMTRTEDVHMDLQDRVDFAKALNADVLISVHYNASAHHRFYGTEIFTSAFGEEYAKGHSLAETINSWWVEDGNVSKTVTKTYFVGLDKYLDGQVISPDTPVLRAPRTLVTPHVAFATRESMSLRAQIVFENLRAWMEGRQQNVILG